MVAVGTEVTVGTEEEDGAVVVLSEGFELGMGEGLAVSRKRLGVPVAAGAGDAGGIHGVGLSTAAASTTAAARRRHGLR